MTINVKVGEAKTHLSKLLAKVEAGEEVIISRGPNAIAKLVPVRDRKSRLELIETMLKERSRRKPVTQEEIRLWRDEGRR